MIPGISIPLGMFAVGGFLVTPGDTGSDTASQLVDILNFGRSAAFGDLIVLAVSGRDGAFVNGSMTASVTGMTAVAHKIANNGFNYTGFSGLFYKTASGGETSLSFSGSYANSNNNTDSTYQVFLISGLDSNTPFSTNTSTGNSINDDTTGALLSVMVRHSVSGTESTSGGGDTTTYPLGGAWCDFAAIDVAPPGGSTTYTFATGGGTECNSIALWA